MFKYSSTTQTLTTSFRILWCFLPEPVIITMVAKWWFFSLHHFSVYWLAFYYVEECSLFPCFYHYGLLNSYFIQWVLILCYHYLSWCSHCPNLGHLEQLLAAIPFCYISIILLYVLSGTMCPGLIIYFPCSSPEISHFSRSPDSFWWRMVFRSQVLHIKCAYSYWGVQDQFKLNF